MIEQTSTRTQTKKINGDSLTPILIFRRLQGKHKFLLESRSNHDGPGRYSFMGMNPRKTYKGSGTTLEEIGHKSGKNYTHEGEMFTLLKRLMPRIGDNIEFPFTGGAVGYVGYSAGRDQSKGPADDLNLPDVHFNIYETIIVFDHLLNEVTLLHTEIEAVHEPFDFTALEEQIMSAPEEKNGEFELGEFTCPTTEEQFKQLVEQGIEFIERGEIEQIVLSRRLEADFEGDPFAVYRTLRRKNPSPYMYYMDFEDYIIVGASPESLVQVSDRKVLMNPIAGTRKRGKNEKEDAQLAEELLADPKEIAEHEMLVERGVEEAETVAMPDTVQVTKHMEVAYYEHVMHLVSEIEGELHTALHPIDALTASLPAGTVTGTPKQRAMELIDELEEIHRGIYGGAIGYIGFNGNIDFALTIRTMFIQAKKAYVQSGAGIVAASKPHDEFMETVNKARSLVNLMK